MNSENDIESYVLHAEFALEFRCKFCGRRMSDSDIMHEHFTEQWFRALGAQGANEGWKVLNEWEAVCPECVKSGKC